MSVKQRVTDIATQVATSVANQIAEIRTRQVQASLSTMAKVTKVDGNQCTLSMPDGTLRTVTNLGGRILGIGDAMVTDGAMFGI